jgi:hypothetical protein
VRLRRRTIFGFDSARTRGRCSSSTSKTAKGVGFISALAAPQARFEPEELVVTSPRLETILTKAFVVDVFPLVAETRRTVLSMERSFRAVGANLSRTRPGIVSPDLRRKVLETHPRNSATTLEKFSRRLLFII